MSLDIDVVRPRQIVPPFSDDTLSAKARLFSKEIMSADVSSFLDAAKEEIPLYDKYITALESHLEAIKKERQQLREYQAKVSSLFAPIRRLPYEILRAVFLQALYGKSKEGNNLFGIFSSWKSTAFSISAVCTRWREIALDTPDLWSWFAFEVAERARAPVELCLSRSRDQPLTFTMIVPPDNIFDVGLVKDMIAHLGRWGSVDYWDITSNPEARELLAGIAGSSFPSLRNAVCIAFNPDVSDELQQDVLKQFPGAERLKSLTVRYYETKTTSKVEHLPLARIRDLSFQHGPEGSFQKGLKILEACETLESLSYESPPNLIDSNRDTIQSAYHHQISGVDHSSFSISRVECGKLKSLSLQLYHENGMYALLTDIFHFLTLPALESLSFNCGSDNGSTFDGEWPMATFRSFLDRSQCQLRTLNLTGLPLTETEVLRLLELTPSLEALTIQEFGTPGYRLENYPNYSWQDNSDFYVKTVTKAVVSRFQVHQGQGIAGVFLPRLRSLKMHVLMHFDAATEVVEMVKSRWYHSGDSPSSSITSKGHVPLSEFVLIVPRKDELGDVFDSLKALDEEGMCVVVKRKTEVIV